MKIRSDVVGIVTAYKDGAPIFLKAGDTVPAGVVVGSHVADGKPEEVKPDKPADPAKPASPFEGMKGAELKAYAVEHGIDLGKEKAVAGIRAILEASIAAPAEPEKSDPEASDENDEQNDAGDTPGAEN